MRRARFGRRFVRLHAVNLVRRDTDGLLVYRLLLRRVGEAGFVRYDRLPVETTSHRHGAPLPRLRRVA